MVYKIGLQDWCTEILGSVEHKISIANEISLKDSCYFIFIRDIWAEGFSN